MNYSSLDSRYDLKISNENKFSLPRNFLLKNVKLIKLYALSIKFVKFHRAQHNRNLKNSGTSLAEPWEKEF